MFSWVKAVHSLGAVEHVRNILWIHYTVWTAFVSFSKSSRAYIDRSGAVIGVPLSYRQICFLVTDKWLSIVNSLLSVMLSIAVLTTEVSCLLLC